MNKVYEEFLAHLNDPTKITELWVDEDGSVSIDPRTYGYNEYPEGEEWKQRVAGDPDEMDQEIPNWIKEW